MSSCHQSCCSLQDGRAAGAEFDMFAEEAEPAAAPAQRTSGAAALADSYDDAEGYYNLQARFQTLVIWPPAFLPQPSMMSLFVDLKPTLRVTHTTGLPGICHICFICMLAARPVHRDGRFQTCFPKNTWHRWARW